MKIAVFLALVGSFYANASNPSVSDIKSMTLRDDGKYDVICKNGKKEIATIEQIKSDDVCRASQNHKVEAIFEHSKDDFYVLCSNHRWEIATDDQIKASEVCGKPTSAIGFTQEFADTSSHSEDYLLGVKVKVQKGGKAHRWGIITKEGTPGGYGRLALYNLEQKLVAQSKNFQLDASGRKEVAGDLEYIEPGEYWLMTNFSKSTKMGQNSTTVDVLYMSLPFTGKIPETLSDVKSYTSNSGPWNVYLVTK